MLTSKTFKTQKAAEKDLIESGFDKDSRLGSWKNQAGTVARIRQVAGEKDASGAVKNMGVEIEYTSAAEERQQDAEYAVFSVISDGARDAERGLEVAREWAERLRSTAQRMLLRLNLEGVAEPKDVRYAMSSAADDLRTILLNGQDAEKAMTRGADAMDKLMGRDLRLLDLLQDGHVKAHAVEKLTELKITVK